eukprot:759802-Hanusia_phi.AAC.1
MRARATCQYVGCKTAMVNEPPIAQLRGRSTQRGTKGAGAQDLIWLDIRFLLPGGFSDEGTWALVSRLLTVEGPQPNLQVRFALWIGRPTTQEVGRNLSQRQRRHDPWEQGAPR